MTVGRLIIFQNYLNGGTIFFEHFTLRTYDSTAKKIYENDNAAIEVIEDICESKKYILQHIVGRWRLETLLLKRVNKMRWLLC